MNSLEMGAHRKPTQDLKRNWQNERSEQRQEMHDRELQHDFSRELQACLAI